MRSSSGASTGKFPLKRVFFPLALILLLMIPMVWLAPAGAQVDSALTPSAEVPLGLIAYIGEDGNVYTVLPDGTNRKQLTSDAWDPRRIWPRVSYHNLAWSADGTYLYFVRIDDSHGFNFMRVEAFVSWLGALPPKQVPPPMPPSGNASPSVPLGLTGDGTGVYFAERWPRRGGMYPCVSPGGGHPLWVVDIESGQARELFRTDDGDEWWSFRVSADGQYVMVHQITSTISYRNPVEADAYKGIENVVIGTDPATGHYGCVDTTRTCRVRLSDGTRSCVDSPLDLGAASINDPASPRLLTANVLADRRVEIRSLDYETLGAIQISAWNPPPSQEHVLSSFSPKADAYALLAAPPEAFPRAADIDCSAPDVLSQDIYLYVADSISAEPSLVDSDVFPVRPAWGPANKYILIGRLIGTMPNQFGNDLPCLRPARVSFVWRNLETGEEREIGRTIGRNDVGSVPPPAWQPALVPPVLFVHGCGGSLGTWTDPGWITDTTEIAQFTAGEASGKLYRGVIPGTPAVPAYALDYGKSPGSIFDLAALLPQAIDKIQEETGREKVMLVTHSMGGVLTQAYVGGLASVRGFNDDVAASFMVAPPSRGSFLVNWLTGKAGNALACPQASELGSNSQSITRLRAADLPDLDYSIVSGTRFWIPFVGLNDGVIADGDVGLSNAAYDKRQVRGIHTDVQLLPNTVAALCQTVLGGPCTPELRMDEVKVLFRQRYKEDMFK